MVTRSPVLFAYANTDEGQMHLTTCGAGDAVVLLHWTPLSARMYEHEIPTLAELGYQVIAVDLMGFGRSAKPGRVLTFERHAELLGQALCNHGITTCSVLGGHFSAPVAVQLTLGPRQRSMHWCWMAAAICCHPPPRRRLARKWPICQAPVFMPTARIARSCGNRR